ncbi:5-oxoprolinase subunit PxpB [Pseudomonas sp. PSKL.D1]|uniref:5-oxoprolinase subunit PxpB n=1 Tax=Pseudomonas sp. PSKL.D1 TaxID=3029060 RepID=UPI00238173B5|nr:5-oxoprolinase subunit PxpB [Pseudomonas sp. PSKL.D1]WDY55777.1 5-oxoprolinase subunit PxpB [Pseudomonas sp. PSKL.D1]
MKNLQFHRMGTRAVLIECQQAQASVEVQQICWGLDLLSQELAGLTESVPGMNNLLLIFDSLQARENAFPRLPELWHLASDQNQQRESRCIKIGVHYGGDRGADLSELARHAGLSINQFVERHARSQYTVFCLGAHPGFAYLGGLESALHAPRRSAPRQRVEAGSVAIGGSQTGVIAATMPSGWNLIGSTEQVFFDHRLDPPALLAPGDRVQFEILEVSA